MFVITMVHDALPSVETLPISLYRGEYASEKCLVARTLFQCLDDIAWKTGPYRRNKIDKRGLRAMVENHCNVTRAIPDFLLIEAKKQLSFPYEISLRALYSLFAIQEAWNIMKKLLYLGTMEKSVTIIKRYHFADKLLAMADHYADMEEKEALYLIKMDAESIKANARSSSKTGGKTGDKISKAIKLEAEKIAKKHQYEKSKPWVWKELCKKCRRRPVKVGEYRIYFLPDETDPTNYENACLQQIEIKDDRSRKAKKPIKYATFLKSYLSSAKRQKNKK